MATGWMDRARAAHLEAAGCVRSEDFGKVGASTIQGLAFAELLAGDLAAVRERQHQDAQLPSGIAMTQTSRTALGLRLAYYCGDDDAAARFATPHALELAFASGETQRIGLLAGCVAAYYDAVGRAMKPRPCARALSERFARWIFPFGFWTAWPRADNPNERDAGPQPARRRRDRPRPRRRAGPPRRSSTPASRAAGENSLRKTPRPRCGRAVRGRSDGPGSRRRRWNSPGATPRRSPSTGSMASSATRAIWKPAAGAARHRAGTRPAHSARSRNRATRGPRHEQSRDRRAAIHWGAHRRDAYRGDLRSLRFDLAHAAARARGRSGRAGRGETLFVEREMRWLVTGGLGFIGSHFIRLALRERPRLEIVNLDAMTYAGNPANLRDVEGDSRYRFLRGNICDAAAVREALDGGVDAIVNFAAETHVDRSIAEPESFLRTDALGSLVLLQALRERADSALSSSFDRRSLRRRAIRRIGRKRSAAPAQSVCGEQGRGRSTRSRLPRDVRFAGRRHARQQHVWAESVSGEDRAALRHESDRRTARSRSMATVCKFATGYTSTITRARSCTCSSTAKSGSVYNVSSATPRTNLELTRELLRRCGRSMESARRARRGSSRTRSPLRRELGEAARARMEPAHLLRRRHRPNDRLVPQQRSLVAPAQGGAWKTIGGPAPR